MDTQKTAMTKPGALKSLGYGLLLALGAILAAVAALAGMAALMR